MKIMLNRSFYYLIPLLLLYSCYEDSEQTTVITQEIEPGISYKNHLEGIVTDSLGNYIADVKVEIGNFTASTNDRGYFKIENVPISEKGSFLATSRFGYIETGIRLYPQKSLSQSLHIIMLARYDRIKLENKSGGTITHDSGLQLSFQAGSMRHMDEIYEGEFQVEIYYSDPKVRNNYQKNLRAYDIASSTPKIHLPRIDWVSLAYIRATGSDGIELQIDPSKPIDIEFPISRFVSERSNSLDLFSFQEVSGLWGESGIASLNGDYYSSMLTNFGWSTVASMQATEILCLDFMPSGNSSFTDYLFVVNTVSGTPVYYGQVDDINDVCFPAPVAEDLVVNVYNSCFSVIAETIIPGSRMERVYNIEYIPSDITSTKINVNLTDCNDQATEGNYLVNYGNSSNQIEISGSTFEITLPECFQGDQLNIVLEDKSTRQLYSGSFIIEQGLPIIQRKFKICDDEAIQQGTIIINGTILQNCVAVYNPEEVLIYSSDPGLLIGYDHVNNGPTPCRVVYSTVTDSGIAMIENEANVGSYINGSFEVSDSATSEMIIGRFSALRIK